MKKKARTKRVIVEWQTRDQGANPLTPRGRKWLRKEIKACNEKALRKKLEHQVFTDTNEDSPYWNWTEKHYPSELPQANPDVLSDEQ